MGFNDLQVAKNIAKKEGKVYCIIPDVAANWVISSQTNPLSIDWPQNSELGRQELVDRIIEDLEAHRGGLIVIVQKYQASSLASGFTPLPMCVRLSNPSIHQPLSFGIRIPGRGKCCIK